jgi:DNA-binding transcriptional LysR family regulator
MPLRQVKSNDHQSLKYFINHDEEDQITYRYFDKNKIANHKSDRIFFDEIYSVIDAVAAGLGRSVLPRHLVVNDERLKIYRKCIR